MSDLKIFFSPGKTGKEQLSLHGSSSVVSRAHNSANFQFFFFFSFYDPDSTSWDLIDGQNIDNVTSSKEHVSGIHGLSKDGDSKI